MKRVIIAMMLALLAAPLLTGCNTVEGAGRDIEGAGEAVQDAAQDAKN